MSKTCKRFIIIGCIAVVCAFTMMVTTIVRSEAETLSPAYKVVTVYCFNNNCREDKTIDSKLENTLNKIKQNTTNFQKIVSIVPIPGLSGSVILGIAFPVNSGYTIIIEYLK